ncbi:MAG: sulfotransferase [Candidatus Tectomicrobia bacterium]|nr:sulfotransferase [Candidatus Tectomicrobia bacterium]
MNSESSSPLCIVGSGRCGTTLLVAMLNASGNLHIPYESSFLVRAEPFFSKSKITEDDYEILAHLFFLTSEKKGWGLSSESLVGAMKRCRPTTLAGVVDVICREYLDQAGLAESVEWGLKRPLMICHLDRVYRCFPSAKVIHVVRDGRDVSLSYRELHKKSEVKFGPRGVVTSALYWIAGLRMAEKHERQFLTVRYEDLIKRPSKELTRIERFAKIEGLVDGGLTYAEQVTPSVVTDTAAKFIHQKVYKGVDASNAYKYKTGMRWHERFVFEAIASRYLMKYGYAQEFSGITWLFFPFRFAASRAAVFFNRMRYAKRDKMFYAQALAAVETCSPNDLCA